MWSLPANLMCGDLGRYNSGLFQMPRAPSLSIALLVSSPLRDLTRESNLVAAKTPPYIRSHGDQQQSSSLHRTRLPEHHRRRATLERLREPESSAEEGDGSRHGARDQRWRRGAGPAGLRPVPARHPSPSTRRRRHWEAQGPEGHRQRRQLQGAAPGRPAPHREARGDGVAAGGAVRDRRGGAEALPRVPAERRRASHRRRQGACRVLRADDGSQRAPICHRARVRHGDLAYRRCVLGAAGRFSLLDFGAPTATHLAS